jgi:hypothetical protein
METQHQAGKQPEKAQKSNENEQPFSETTPLLPSQMALANPNTLTPAAINALQRTHGNRYVTTLVQRMRLTQSPPFLIRRRVPEAGDIDDEALQTPNAGTNTVNVEGLRTVLRRVLQDITDDNLRSQFLNRRIDGMPVRQVIENGDRNQLLALVRMMEADPQLQPFVMTNTTQTSIPAQQSPSFARVQAVVDTLHQQLTAITATAAHNQHLRDVFGHNPLYGWRQAKARYARAADEMRRALNQGILVTDRTGAPEEMSYTGASVTGLFLMVAARHMDNPETDDAKSTFVHESFHFAFDDVHDDGNHRYGGDFATCSALRKFTNAEHYAEVYRRSVGQGQVGSRYRPSREIGGTGEARTPNRQAYDAAVNRLRRAMIGSTRIHHATRVYYNEQQQGLSLDAEAVTRMRNHSRLVALTYHQRWNGTNTLINQIDITLAEGVSRRLFEARQMLARFRATADSGPTSAEAYLQAVLLGHGQITGSTERDLQVVAYMDEHLENLVEGDPIPPVAF